MEQTRRTRLRDGVADQLLEMVIPGGLEPGERLPPERELCARLGVSRTVVREALNLLEARGLISIEHGRGAVVSGGGQRAVRDTLGLLLRVQPKTLWELLEMRKILEAEVDLLRASRRVSAARAGNALRALGEHERILSQVEARDTEGAREEMRVHLAKTSEDIEAAIGE